MLKKMQDELINYDIHFHTKTGFNGVEIINVHSPNYKLIIIKINENNVEFPYCLHIPNENFKLYTKHTHDIIGVLELKL